MAQDFYRIKPGDTLQVEVLEDPSLNRNVLVLPDGSISFPMAGTVRAGGRSVDVVASTLSKEMTGNFAVEPTVLVSVAALAPRDAPRAAAGPELMNIYIVGEANTPGRKEVLPGTTLLQFLAEAGGLSRFAAEKRIQLRRVDPTSNQETVYRFNYRTMGGSDSISGTTVLAPGDVIVVPERRLFE
ncbi:polysaccharide biosynthesis/export family protein [Roseovarius sp. MBR-51]